MKLSLVPDPPPPLSPYLERRFEILEIIGRGTFGTVYRARDLMNEQRECALKVALLKKTDDGSLEMFRDEFRILATLDHPHVARVFDFGDVPSISADALPTVFFTSEFIPGSMLFDAAEKAPLSVIINLLRQITEALVFLSNRGIVHRDLKSSNILVHETNSGPNAKLVDFGVAVKFDHQTSTHVAGTLQYMPPEILHGKTFDTRSDLYSLGVIAYFLLTRCFPYEGQTVFEILDAQRLTIPRSIGEFRRDLPPTFASIIYRLLALSPTERFFSAQQFLDELNLAFPETSPNSQGSAHPDPAGRFPHLIGRDEELSALDTLFDNVSSGRVDAKTVCMITGDVGFGKTKILQGLKTSVQLKSGCVLSATSDTFTDGARGVLAAWNEEIRSFLSLAPPQAAKAGSQQPWKDFIERSRELPRVGCPGIIILLDSIHDFEKPTFEFLLGLLAEIRRCNPPPPVLVVATRTPEIEIDADTLEILQQISDDPSTQVIRLRPFDLATVETCVEAATNRPIDIKEKAENIFKRTGGHPLLVKEAVLSDLPVGELSDSVRDVLQRRIRKMSLREERVCHLLAVLAEPLTFQELRSMIAASSLDADDISLPGILLQLMNRLQYLSIIRSELMRGKVVYTFEHEFLRELVYQSISEPKRLQMHRFIASYLENCQTPAKEIQRKILVHCLRGRHLERVLELLPSEIARCESETDYARTITLLESSLNLIATAGGFPKIKHIELLRKTARFCVLHGELTRAEAHLLQAQRIPEAKNLPKAIQVGLILELAEVYQLMLKPQEALICLDDAAKILPHLPLGAEKLRAVWIRGRVLYRLGNFETMRQEVDDHIELAMTLRLPREAAELLYNRGIALTSLEQREIALRDLLQSLSLFENSGSTERTFYPLNAIGLTHQHMGNYEDALQYYKRAYEVANCFSNNRLLINAAMNLATVYHQRREFIQALEFYEKAKEAAERTQQKGELARVLKNLGILFLHFGHHSRAEEQFRRCLKIATQTDLLEEKAWAHLYFADLALATSDLSAARLHLNESIQLFRPLSLDRALITALQGLAAVEISLDNLTKAAEILHQTQALIDQQSGPEERFVQHWRWAEYYARCLARKNSGDAVQLALKHVRSAFSLAKEQRIYRCLWMISELEARIAELTGDLIEQSRLYRKALDLAQEYAGQIPEEFRHFFLNSPKIKNLQQKNAQL